MENIAHIVYVCYGLLFGVLAVVSLVRRILVEVVGMWIWWKHVRF